MVYRDVAHVVARVMSIEAIDGTSKPSWQSRYVSGWPEVRSGGESLSDAERLAQDSMTRAVLHRELPAAAWNVLMAKYSINDHEVVRAVQWLTSRVESPAHHLFKMKCTTAWAIPKRLPSEFYVLHTWDADGVPESTLRRWRVVTRRWLED